jgi:hypothetical protein
MTSVGDCARQLSRLILDAIRDPTPYILRSRPGITFAETATSSWPVSPWGKPRR